MQMHDSEDQREWETILAFNKGKLSSVEKLFMNSSSTELSCCVAVPTEPSLNGLCISNTRLLYFELPQIVLDPRCYLWGLIVFVRLGVRLSRHQVVLPPKQSICQQKKCSWRKGKDAKKSFCQANSIVFCIRPPRCSQCRALHFLGCCKALALRLPEPILFEVPFSSASLICFLVNHLLCSLRITVCKGESVLWS